MNEKAEEMRDIAIATVASNVATTLKVKKHSYLKAAQEMGFYERSTVYRMVNPSKQRPNGKIYGPVTTLDLVAAALSYCNMEFADLGDSGQRGSWQDVATAMDGLELNEKERLHLKEITYLHYQHMKSTGWPQKESQEEPSTTEKDVFK